MMKYLIKITAALFLFFYFQKTSLAQQHEECVTDEVEMFFKTEKPNRENERKIYNQQIQKWIGDNTENKSVTVLTVPVVFHVMLDGNPASDISEAEANQYLDLLNNDFRKLNADTVDIPAPFQPLAADTEIEFCLAQQDPSGAPHSGIERRDTDIPIFVNHQMKSYINGGLDAWDVTRYFNIWVCKFQYNNGPAHAFGTFPSSFPNSNYGVVIDRGWLGIGVNTLTHEVGHCLNLYHIWGNSAGVLCDTDEVDDTPPQSASSGCFDFPFVDICSPDSNGRMFMNYMDYSGCRNMFTIGQADRMRAVLSIPPYDALTTSDGCEPVFLEANDAGSITILSPNEEICNANDITPEVVIRNWGTTALTSVNINYQINSEPPQMYSWTGNLASLDYDTLILPPIYIPDDGVHQLTMTTSEPNAVTDENILNDTAKIDVQITTKGEISSLAYGFEELNFPTENWQIVHSDFSDIEMERSTDAAHSGVASLRVDMLNNQFKSASLVSESLDFSNAIEPQLTFEVAHRLRWVNPGWNDSLSVYVSTDCGQSWDSLFSKINDELATISGVVEADYIPEPNDWRMETIDLSAYAGHPNVRIEIRFSCSWGTIVWMDDINIFSKSTSTNNISKNENLEIFPNPNNGNFMIDIESENSDDYFLEIRNMLGRLVLQKEINNVQGDFREEISLKNQEQGVYFVSLKNKKNNKFFSKKIIIQ